MDVIEFQFTPHFMYSVAIHLIVCVIMWVLVFCAIFVDLWDRIYTQKKLGKPIDSHSMRKTLGKLGEYWRVLLIAFIVDTAIFIACTLLNIKTIPVITILVAIGLLIIEAKSLIEHARERKSKVKDIQKIIQSVVKASSDRDAKKVIQYVAEYIGEEKNVNQKIE